MPTTLSQVDIVNGALSRLGVAAIADIADTASESQAVAEQARINWPLALAEVGRAHTWNCIRKPAVLVAAAQDPIAPPTPVPASTPWAPATNYAVGDYVSFGSPAYLYQCLVANLSTASFTNDLTSGFWFQTDLFDANPFSGSGANYPSGWAYKYPLPEESLRVCTFNGAPITEVEEDFEIMGADLYCDEAQAIIKYTWAEPDTTRYDALFVECLILNLASKMATKLRQDDTQIAADLKGQYVKALRSARTVDGNERRPRRYSPKDNSRWLNSRTFSTNS